MEINALAKEVLNSNLSNDTKIYVMEALFKAKETYYLTKIYEQTPDQSSITPWEGSLWSPLLS